MARVEIDKLTKTFGDVAVLKDVSLAIDSGQFVVFVGPSGCGKSTLLRLIAGLEEPTGGEIRFDGVRVNERSPAAREIAMVFQSYALYPHMNVYDNMAFSLKLRKAPKAEIDAAVRAAARMLDIEPLLARRPRELSGGQRQRVAIGRAIVRKPKVFLFDEPLSNLDAELRARMRYEIARLHEQIGATMIYVTHDQVEAMTLADTIVALSKGRIEQIGAPMALYRNPANLFVAGFIGSPKMNFFAAELVEGRADGARVRLGDGAEFEARVDASRAQRGERVTLGVRPEHLERAETPGPNTIAITVDFVERLGGATHAHAATPGAEDGLTIRCDEWPVERGAGLTVRLPPEDCHLFDAGGDAFERIAKP